MVKSLLAMVFYVHEIQIRFFFISSGIYLKGNACHGHLFVYSTFILPSYSLFRLLFRHFATEFVQQDF